MQASGGGRGLGFIFGDKKAGGSDKQDCGEEVGYCLEVGEECEASGDKEAAQEDCAGDSPEEDAVLVGATDLEEAEEEKEDEEIVDGEGLLDGVPGEILRARGGAEGVMDEDGEGEGGGDPEGCGGEGCAVCRAGEARLAAGVDQLCGEEEQEGEVEADPFCCGRRRLCQRRVGHRLMLSRPAQRWLMRRMDSRKRSAEICRDCGLILSMVSCAVWW